MQYLNSDRPLYNDPADNPPDTGSGDPNDDGGGTDVPDDSKAGSFDGEE